MSKSLRIDSPFWGWAMPKSYSGDLRERVIEAVEMGAYARKLGSRPRARGLARRDVHHFDHSSISQTASLA